MLAVIGKVLLVIVLILLVLLGALLLVPLRYRLQVRKYPGRSLEGSFGVSWLLRFVSLCGTLSGDRVLDMSLKICGFTLKKIRKGGNIPESKETDSPEPEKQKENDSGRADDTPPAGGQMYGDDADRYGVEEPVPSAAGMTEHPGIRAEDPHSEADESPYEELPESIRDKASEASEDSYKGPPRRIRRLRNRKNQKKESAGEAHREKGGLFRKIPELLQTVCEKICDLVLAAADGADRAEEALSQAAGKADGIMRTYDRWVTGPNTDAVRHIMRRGRILLRHYLPRVMEGHLKFGTGMPDITGYAVGLLSLVLPAGAQDYHVEPDFYEVCLDTDTAIKGYIRLIHVLIGAAALLLDRNFRKLLRSLLRARKGGKNG